MLDEINDGKVSNVVTGMWIKFTSENKLPKFVITSFTL